MSFIKINKNLLQKSINQAGIGREVKAAQVCHAFDQILEKLNKKARGNVQAMSYSYKDKVLTVAVKSSVWTSEIQALNHIIIEEINNKLGGDLLSRIRFKIVG
jgi:hypothetical protein